MQHIVMKGREFRGILEASLPRLTHPKLRSVFLGACIECMSILRDLVRLQQKGEGIRGVRRLVNGRETNEKRKPMRFLTALWGGSLLIFQGGSALAQRNVTLDEALALARRNNHDLAAARTHVAQAQAMVELARSSLLPQLSGQGRYTHNYKQVELMLPAELGQSGTIVIQKQEQFDMSTTLTVPLLVPGAYPALASAQRSFDAARANFRTDETAILYQTAQSFYAAAGADEVVGARRHAVEVALKTLADARARLAAGTVTRVEISRAEAALIRARQSVVEAEQIRDQVYRALGILLVVEGPLHVVPPDLPLGTTAASLDEALHLRPEINAAEQQIRAADSAARAFGWRWAPTLSGFGNARGFNYPGFAGDDYAWAVGLQLDWLIYEGGARDAQRHQALAQRTEAEQRLALLRENVGAELANAAQQIEVRRSALEAAQRQLDLARETLGLVRQQHQAGTATQLDLLTAQDALVAAEVGLAQARFDVQLANLALARAAGTFPEARLQ
jgi:outer membrane protein TolC